MDKNEAIEVLLAIDRGEINLAAALGMHPEILERLADKAMELINHGKAEEAEELLTNLCQVETRSDMLPFLLGSCRAHRKDLVGAVSAYSESIQRLQPDSAPAFVQQVYLCRAQALLLLEDHERADEDLNIVANGEDETMATQAKAWLAMGGE